MPPYSQKKDRDRQARRDKVVGDKALKDAEKKVILPNPLLLEAKHLRLKKRFSQHFLINGGVLEQICNLMELTSEDTILEIGPGGGFLTGKLLEKAGTVIAVELDSRMCDYLAKKFPAHLHPNFRLAQQDILRFNFDPIPAPKFKIVGNLPYQITSKIMFLLAGELEQVHYPLRERISQLTVMVQREVAERITATPGHRAYNALSIALQFWFEARLEFEVPSKDFSPPPKVESAVVVLTPRSAPAVDVQDIALFAKLVKGAFSQKRKTIRNALMHASFASGETIDRVFERVGVNTGLRAEAISIQIFGALANAFGTDAR